DTFAPTAAAGFAEQLLEIWPRVPDAADRAGIDVATLHIELALLCQADPPRALRVARAGLRGDVDVLARARLLGEGAAALHNLGRIADFAEQIAEAIDLLDDSDAAHRPVLARLLSLQSSLPATM